VNFVTAELDRSLRVVTSRDGSYLYLLSCSFGLVKLGTGAGSTVPGKHYQQNCSLSLHAPFGNLAYVSKLPPLESYIPSDMSVPVGPFLLLRSQLTPVSLLIIDAETLKILPFVCHLPSPFDKNSQAQSRFAWRLSLSDRSKSTFADDETIPLTEESVFREELKVPSYVWMHFTPRTEFGLLAKLCRTVMEWSLSSLMDLNVPITPSFLQFGFRLAVR
jgi:hypothetical protein